MWHLYKNANGKFEFAFINKGRYIAGTKQGYERGSDAKRVLFTLLSSACSTSDKFIIQDDTGLKPVVIYLFKRGHTSTDFKPKLPYHGE
jgi:hypothetical protein